MLGCFRKGMARTTKCIFQLKLSDLTFKSYMALKLFKKCLKHTQTDTIQLVEDSRLTTGVLKINNQIMPALHSRSAQSSSQMSLFCINIQRLNRAKQTKKLRTVLQRNNDVNIVVDRKGYIKTTDTNKNCRALINAWLKHEKWVDAFDYHHPGKKSYTRESKQKKKGKEVALTTA